MADKKVYRYPYTLITDSTDYLQIDIVEYVPILSNTGSFAGRPGTRRVNNGTKRLKTILLPIPSNIQDGNATKFGDSSLNSIAGAALGGIVNTMEAGATLNLGEVGNRIRQGLADTANAGGGLAGAQGFVTRSLASKAIGILGANVTADQILARQQGEILNPNLELLFNGPTLRSFRFQFKMTPRNDLEGGEIKELIRCIKKNMAPKVRGTNIRNTPNDIGDNANNTTFLKTPNVFELRYRQGNGDHQFLHSFKQCFLESINVNYTGDGTYATYDDGTPVSIIMDLTFKEIEPIYDIDYDEEFVGPLRSGSEAVKGAPRGVGY
jgi:hypothetical protein